MTESKLISCEHIISVDDAFAPLIYFDFAGADETDDADVIMRVVFIYENRALVNGLFRTTMDQGGEPISGAGNIQIAYFDPKREEPVNEDALVAYAMKLVNEYCITFDDEDEIEVCDTLTLIDLSLDEPQTIN